jgi:8-oxo-dGTP pyrophosphatase MutT (NUDIX family)/SAM-dependent methyltransferase
MPVPDVLDKYRPLTLAEAADVERIRALCRTAADPWQRSAALHLTASAVIVHPESGTVLLRWHQRLQSWLQVGGHADPGEHDPLAIALREAAEETGLDDLVPWPDDQLRHVVIVPVPAADDEPAHEHADVRFVFRTANPERARAERPGAPVRWLPLDEARQLVAPNNLAETLDRIGQLLHAGDERERARQRDLVRRGYDAISLAYRDDAGRPHSSSAEDVSKYAGWADELADLLPAGARVIDLGCGSGVPGTRLLTERGLRVAGVDFSAVQLRRARRLVPAAGLIQADLAELRLRPASVDAAVSFYALIHMPLADQPPLLHRIASWLRPGGLLMATVGAERWQGTETYHGAEMFWEHADTATYLRWLGDAGLTPCWHRYVPEGETAGHTLILARRAS